MSAAALLAQGYPVRYRRPGRRRGVVAIVASRVSREGEYQSQTRGRERTLDFVLLFAFARWGGSGATTIDARDAHILELRGGVTEEYVPLA
jgi:hypothetical protein